MSELYFKRPYEARPVRFCGVRDVRGWRVKVYEIAYRAEALDGAFVEAAWRVVEGALPQPPTTEERYGVAFVILHRCPTESCLQVDWWADDNTIYQRTFHAPHGAPGDVRPIDNEMMACAWEVRVQSFERDAWVERVLTGGGGPDVEGYLAVGLEGMV